MQIFNYENFELTLNMPEILLVKEFKEVVESDTSKDKRWAFKVFTYVWLSLDWRSPFVNYTEELRLKESLKQSSLTDEESKSEFVVRCFLKYKELLDSNLKLSIVGDMRKSIEQYRHYFRTVNFTEKVESGARKGTLLYDPEQYIKIMKNTNEIFNAIDVMEETLRKELSGKDFCTW